MAKIFSIKTGERIPESGIPGLVHGASSPEELSLQDLPREVLIDRLACYIHEANRLLCSGHLGTPELSRLQDLRELLSNQLNDEEIGLAYMRSDDMGDN